jgi:2-isopropylmalate synthase
LADSKKDVSDEDLEALVGTEKEKSEMGMKLESLQVTCGKSTIPTATVQVSFDGDVFTETATGNGPVSTQLFRL